MNSSGIRLSTLESLSRGEVTVSNNWYGFPTGTYRALHPNESYGFNTWGVGIQETGVSLESFGLNTASWLVFDGTVGLEKGIADGRVASPGDMIAMADYDPNDGDGDHSDCLFGYGLTGKHHGRRANVVFCDGHVEYARTNAWAAPDYNFRTGPRNESVRMRWNNDHQIHPGLLWLP